MRVSVLCIGIFIMATCVSHAGVVTGFEDLSLASDSRWNGSDGSGGFTSGGAYFKNNYNAQYGSWDGFAYSNKTDTVTSGWSAQFNAITGVGYGGSANYGIGYDPVPSYFGIERPTVTLTSQQILGGLYITNTCYAYYSMLEGDGFAKKFGGEAGNDQDWLKLIITGKNAQGGVTGTVEFYLADFRFADNSRDYIVDTWKYVDLSSLGTIKSIYFSISSSDSDPVYGMNTPAYFAIDTVVPEPATMALFAIGTLLMRQGKKK